MDEAKKSGIKKGLIAGGGMGVVFFIMFACYALAFWYGAKLVREEPENYTAGTMLIVSNSVAGLKDIMKALGDSHMLT